MIENPLKSLRIKNYYSYLLVLGGSILIISLFYEPKVIPQAKLTILSLITIVYGLAEWIRESQFNDRGKQLNKEWLVYWEEESAKKGIAEVMDNTWEANLRKNFKEKYDVDRLMPNYQTKTWIFFIIYLALMVLAFCWN